MRRGYWARSACAYTLPLVRVAVDTSVVDRTVGGPATYTRELVAALRRVAPEVDYLEFRHRSLIGRASAARRRLDGAQRELWWLPRRLARLAVRQRADVLHGPSQSIPVAANLPLVVTMYDMYIERDPAAFPRWQVALSNRYQGRMLSRADAVIAISEFTKQELLRCFPKLPAGKITVTHLGVSPDFRPLDPREVAERLARYRVRRPYLLSVCTLEPRKNLRRLVSAFARVADAMPHDLVLVGEAGRETDGLLEHIRALGLADRVTITGPVPGEELPWLYNAASMFVYVPLYEGFGLPPLEAMACGTPVVTSRGSALDETAGSAAVRVDALDTQAIADAIRLVAQDEAVARDLSARGSAWAQRFSWDRCAHETLSVYRSAIAAWHGRVA